MILSRLALLRREEVMAVIQQRPVRDHIVFLGYAISIYIRLSTFYEQIQSCYVIRNINRCHIDLYQASRASTWPPESISRARCPSIHTYTYMYIYIERERDTLCIYVYIHCVYTCIYIYIYTHIMYTYIPIYLNYYKLCVCVYIYIYIYI